MKCLTALKCFKVWAFCHFLRWLIMRCRWRCWRILAERSKVNLRTYYTFKSRQQYLSVCGLTKPRPPMYSLHGASQGGKGRKWTRRTGPRWNSEIYGLVEGLPTKTPQTKCSPINSKTVLRNIIPESCVPLHLPPYQFMWDYSSIKWGAQR